MKIVLRTEKQILLTLSSEEICGIATALNEVCNGIDIEDSEFETRLGASRESLRGILSSINETPHDSSRAYERSDVWEEIGVVMVRVLSVFGDPVEMNTTEATEFVATLQNAITQAQQ